MKPVIIIAIAFVFLVIPQVYAQTQGISITAVAEEGSNIILVTGHTVSGYTGGTLWLSAKTEFTPNNNPNPKTRITRYEMPNIAFLGTISVKDDRRFHAQCLSIVVQYFGV